MIEERKPINVSGRISFMLTLKEDPKDLAEFMYTIRILNYQGEISQNVSSKNNSQDFPENSQKVEGSK